MKILKRLCLTVKSYKFNVLVFTQDGYYCAQCLETGNVVTADDVLTVESMIAELLADEVDYALSHNSFTNLFSTPASADIQRRFNIYLIS